LIPVPSNNPLKSTWLGWYAEIWGLCCLPSCCRVINEFTPLLPGIASCPAGYTHKFSGGSMFGSELTTAVYHFAALFVNVPDTDLDHPWSWKGHEEGVRFAFFLANLELRQLAVELAENRTRPQPVHRILSQYHAAYLDLQAVLCGLSSEIANRAPSEKDWPVRRVLAHILKTDIGFSTVVNYALEGHRAGKWIPAPMSDEDEIRLIGMSEREYHALMKSPFENLLAYHQDLHHNILTEFASITSKELDQPAVFWEDERFPIRYRLHRYEAHMRQHTIQIDKTLDAIGLSPTEAKRLIRMLYSALAEVDGALIGADETLKDARIELANTLAARITELRGLLG
jgi:hypothetical protein